MSSAKEKNIGKHFLSLPFDINDKNIYIITSYNNKPVNATYFLFDDGNAFFVENNTIANLWNVSQILYDSNGGEIVTNEGDIIYLSKEILIKKPGGEEITLEYESIDTDKITS